MPTIGKKKFGYDLKGIAKAKKYAEKTGKPMKVDSGIYGKTNQYPANRAEAKSPVRKKPYTLKRNLKKKGMS